MIVAGGENGSLGVENLASCLTSASFSMPSVPISCGDTIICLSLPFVITTEVTSMTLGFLRDFRITIARFHEKFLILGSYVSFLDQSFSLRGFHSFCQMHRLCFFVFWVKDLLD